MHTKLTWENGYECHLGLTGNRICKINPEIAAHQNDYYGRTMIALLWEGGRMRQMRVRLVGDDYGLHTPGTGDIIVRPHCYII